MSKLRVHSFSISLDGYGAGPNQCLNDPLGVGGESLHNWVLATRTWRKMHGSKGGRIGIDDGFMARGTVNIGAWIMGRNMFGPLRGSWPDDSWKGWWGTDPPFQTPVFVLALSVVPNVLKWRNGKCRQTVLKKSVAFSNSTWLKAILMSCLTFTIRKGSFSIRGGK
jgi:dihydrofolate reductase